MNELAPEGRARVEEIAQRHGLSADAALTLLRALVAGNGTMAQFNHPELGGMGQWAPGTIMIGDMFNNALKARVDAVCSELAGLLRSQSLFTASSQSQSQSQGGGAGQQGASLFVSGGSGSWWPAELGSPAATGAQNDVRYAWFPGTQRLAIEIGGRLTVYDTLDHQIGGVSQQQGGGSSLTFTSQHGLVRVADLPVVSGANAGAQPSRAPAAAAQPAPGEDVLATIERLAKLKQQGVLSEEEFAAKKAELLKRL